MPSIWFVWQLYERNYVLHYSYRLFLLPFHAFQFIYLTLCVCVCVWLSVFLLFYFMFYFRIFATHFVDIFYYFKCSLGGRERANSGILKLCQKKIQCFSGVRTTYIRGICTSTYEMLYLYLYFRFRFLVYVFVYLYDYVF